jgi:omega-hydroxypalmitate O-feruloyl transferase
VKHADDGKLRVKCNPSEENYGVPFLEAIANCTLSSIHYLNNTDTEIAKHLVFDPQDKSYPLVIMVTKFLCGGFTIGIGMSHAVCDGFGSSQFFKAIIELARGRVEPSVKSVWERERLVGSISKQPFSLCPMINIESAAFSPFLNQTSSTIIKQYCFNVEGEMITRLKSSLMKESENIRFTTFESLAGYVWRSRARALKLSNNGETMLTVVVGMRRNLKDDDALPKGYYGNAVMDGNIVLKVSDLDEKPLYEIVKMIKETKNIVSDTDYVKNSINTLETNYREGFDKEASVAVTILTEWKHLGFLGENADFGGNEAVNLVPAPCNMFGAVDACIFASPNKFDDVDSSMKGGVKIFTSLPVDAMPKFKEEIEALRFLI